MMAEDEGIEKLLSARELLRSCMNNSRALDSAVEKTGSKLQDLSQKLSAIEAALGPHRVQKCSLATIREQVTRALGPAAAVLKVHGSVCELEKSLLSEPSSELLGYLSVIKRLEEALKFLDSNCGLAIQWLEGVMEFLEDNVAEDDKYLLYVRKSLRILQELQETERRARNGGVLSMAFSVLEKEFTILLTENSAQFPLASLSISIGEKACYGESLLPESVTKNLKAIAETLNVNGEVERCVNAYVQVRSSSARSSLGSLEVDYLEMPITEFDDLKSMESYINQWGKHLELAVKNLYEPEYKLCKEIFEAIGSDTWMKCFAKIATQSGILSFLQYGKRITESKDDPLKLLKLLDIFSVLNNLRKDFNHLFGGDACGDIRALTRDLIRHVVDRASKIFGELPEQVELQRRTCPPLDGSVPKLVSFLTNYCNFLLQEDYRHILAQVLAIHQNWKQEKYQEGILTNQIYAVMREIGLNLDAWSKAYEDAILCYFFMMNNHSHFCKLKGTKVGLLMGDSWLEAHEQYRDYYAALYLRESWGRILALLCPDDLNLPSGGRATPRELVKKNLKEFNENFESTYQKQSSWIVSDEILREKMSQLLVQTIVPVYKNYIQDHGILLTQDASESKYVRYTPDYLESRLSLMFQPRSRKNGVARNTDMIHKIKNIVTSQFRYTVTAR